MSQDCPLNELYLAVIACLLRSVFFSRIFGDRSGGKVVEKEEVDEKLTVNDFDLLKIVGKGAFGKVT